MKFNEEMFQKMRDATQKLLASGPAAATVAIQQALQKGNYPGPAVPPAGWNPPQSRPMRDITPTPETETINVPDTGVVNNAETKGRFISGSYSGPAGSRNYKLYIPGNYHGQALPLMAMLHGCTQDPDDFAAGTRMNAIAEERQCFVVYPAQTQSANSSKCWNWFKAMDQQRGQGEPAIIAGITQEIINTQHVDTRRVYIAGMSAGGAMAVIMGTLYPDLYAAAGVHSGLPYACAQDLPSALAAMKSGAAGHRAGNGPSAKATARLNAIPIIVFHGDRDTTVHPSNGEKMMAQNAPQTALQDVLDQRGKTPNGHTYTRTMYPNAEGRVVAEHWLIHGAAHAWSGGSKHGSYTDAKGPDASQEMMRFFYTQAKAC